MEQSASDKPHLIIMIGLPGCGKSYFATNFAESFNCPIISESLIRDRLYDKPSFSQSEDDSISKLSDHFLDEALKTKQTIIYEGKTNAKVDRLELYKKCREKGYQPLLIWVQTDGNTAKKRLVKQVGDKQEAEARYERITKRFYPPSSNEEVVVISGKFTYQSQLKIVLKKIAGHNQSNTVADRPADSRKIIFR